MIYKQIQGDLFPWWGLRGSAPSADSGKLLRSCPKTEGSSIFGFFWPIFDSFSGGNINFVYDPQKKNRK